MFAIIFFCVNIQADSKVDSVVMYRDRVLVTRTASIYLEHAAEVIIPGLPGAIDDASVRIKAPGLKVGEVVVKKGYEKEPHPRVKELQEKIKISEIEDRTLADEINVLKEKEKFLQSITVGGPDIISKEMITGKVSPQSWQTGLKFLTDELLNAKKRQAEIERLRSDLGERLNALKRELSEIKSLTENRKAISFDVRPDAPGDYRFQVSYVLPGASWQTYYELRANPSVSKTSFAFFGKINQRTGEDWHDTKIVLSTAQPAFGGVAPVPEPWYIRLQSPQIILRGYMQLPSEELEYSAKTAESPIALAPPPAPPVEAGISIWYPLPGRYTIASGDPEKKIHIYETAFNTEFEYFVVPRINQLAYSTGKMQNTTDYLFLAGEGSSYVGDDFTGKTYLPTISPEESVTVSFGIDDRVKVKRELTKSKISKGGLFSDKTKYEFVYENSVTNFHNKEIQCTIVDQIPIAQDPDIKVSSLKFEPKPTEEDKDQGIYYWRTAITPTSEYKITVSFTVEAPRGREIQGLVP